MNIIPFAGVPPFWLIHCAVAAVWVYEGLWCKLLGGQPHQLQVVKTVPNYGSRLGKFLIKALGLIEVALAIWVLSRFAPILCAVAQTLLLIALNTGGLLWARQIIHDPAGMVIENFAFLLLAWVSASHPAWT